MSTSHGARALDRSAAIPLWSQLQQDLLRRLEAGAFTDGFPGELELQDTYEVSRHTVREALRRLREAGVIDSSRGRATRVRATRIEQPLGNLYSLFRAVEDQGMVQRSTIIHLGMVTAPEVATRLDRPTDTRLFHLERLRLADGVPLAHDRVWLTPEVGQPLLDSDFTRAAVYDELVKRADVRLTGGTERISAVVPSETERSLLEVPDDVACFSIERVGSVERRPVEYRVSMIRADRYSLLTSWTPRGYDVGAATSSPS